MASQTLASALAVGDLEGEEAVRGVLDQLRARHVGDDDGSVDALDQCAHRPLRALAFNPEDEPVRVQEVVDGMALAGELRERDHVEIDARLRMHPKRLPDLLTGLGRHGAFLDDDVVPVHRLGDGAGGRLDVGKVRGAVGLGRRTHADEAHFGRPDRFFDALRRVKSSLGHHPGDEVRKARLVEPHLAGLEELDHFGVAVDASDVVAEVGQTRGGDQPNVACAYDCNSHR